MNRIVAADEDRPEDPLSVLGRVARAIAEAALGVSEQAVHRRFKRRLAGDGTP